MKKPMATLNDQTSTMTCTEWAGVVLFGFIGAGIFYLFAFLMLL